MRGRSAGTDSIPAAADAQRLRRYPAGLAAQARAAEPAVLAARLPIRIHGAVISAATGTGTRAAAQTLLDAAVPQRRRQQPDAEPSSSGNPLPARGARQ
jgi:hypothetical protein